LSWSASPSPTTQWLRSVYFFGPMSGCAVGDRGTIMRTLNGGDQWDIIPTGIDTNLTSVHFADGLNGWAVGFSGIVLQSTNAGENWSQRAINGIDTSMTVTDVFFVDPSYGWIVANFGQLRSFSKIFKTSDGGTTWSQISTDSTIAMLSLFFVDQDTGWAVGSSKNVLKTTNGGQSWFYQPTPLRRTPTLYNVYFVNKKTGWAVGVKGAILRTTNSGEDWFIQSSNTHNNFYALAMADSAIGWVVGSGGTILKTIDGGGLVDVEPPPPPPIPQVGVRQSIPSPFVPSQKQFVLLPFRTKTSGNVTVRIYDAVGELVYEQNVGYLDAGIYDEKNSFTPSWNGNNLKGSPVPSGTYFFQIITNDFVDGGKLILLR